MRKLFHFLLLIFVIPSIFVYPQGGVGYDTLDGREVNFGEAQETKIFPCVCSYDVMMTLLHQIESGEFEERASLVQLEKINQMLALLAREGLLSSDSKEVLEGDIEEFLGNGYGQALSFERDYRDCIIQTIEYGPMDMMFCGGKVWGKTKKFVKEHKKEIIIGIIAVVVVTTVVTIAVVSSSNVATAAATGVGAGIGTAATKEKISPAERAETRAKTKIEESKETVLDQQLLDNSISIEDSGRVVGAVIAHESVDPEISKEVQEVCHEMIDEAFAVTVNRQETDDIDSRCYQAKGNIALDKRNYDQAIKEFEKALDADPTNIDVYLDRGVAYAKLGDFEEALRDYEAYTVSKPKEMPVIDFSKGFTEGLTEGIKDSGTELARVATDMVMHPIRTGSEILHGISEIQKLASEGDWDTLSKGLAPEMHQLITNWDTLSQKERGELAGYMFGKYGTDLLAPIAVGKVLSKGANAVVALREAKTSCQVAEKTLVLETVSETSIIKTDIKKIPENAHEIVIDSDKLIHSGNVVDRGNLTKAGRSLMKKGYREGSVYYKPFGSPQQINIQGQEVLNSILCHPEKITYEWQHPRFGKIIEVVVPGKGGVRFTSEGEMIGFIEP